MTHFLVRNTNKEDLLKVMAIFGIDDSACNLDLLEAMTVEMKVNEPVRITTRSFILESEKHETNG